MLHKKRPDRAEDTDVMFTLFDLPVLRCQMNRASTTFKDLGRMEKGCLASLWTVFEAIH